ncbi:MAG: CCA tRNA nucleotidyltransferase [Pseudomonadota bacterium]
MTTKITADWLSSDAVRAVCRMLTDAGYQAWFVGGCVRNALIDAPVSDLDLSTNARPRVVVELAEKAGLKAIPTGIDHGTVTVVAGGEPFEITTFRKDVVTDGRRATVAFADDMDSDARRRDFTMNALYADQEGGVADPLDGLPDLMARRVRFIEDPDQRIKEDYLRILRFFRFHAWYGDADAGIDADGLAACADNVDGLATLSRERIGQEFRKLLLASDPAPALASFASTGGLAQILPGADAGALAILVHVEESADLEPDFIRRLAVLGGDEVDQALRLSKAETRGLEALKAATDPAELAYRFDAKAGWDLLAIQAASLGQLIDPAAGQMVDYAAEQTFPLKAVDLTGSFSGPALGRALKEAEARWIASGFTLTKDDLLG